MAQMIPVKPHIIPEVHQLVLGSITTRSLDLKKPFETVAIGVDHDRLRIHSAEPHTILGDGEARRRFNSLGDGRRVHYVPKELLPDDVQTRLGPQAIARP